MMKKVLKITGICVLVLLALLIILPFAFKGKIAGIVQSEANKMLNAKVEFSNLNLSLIRNFPKASIGLENLCVTGVNEFEGDTLIAAKELAATVNIMSLFGSSGFEISKVIVDNARLHAIVNKEGKANWDIMNGDSEDEEEDADTTSNFKMSLQKVLVSATSVYYDDSVSNMSAALGNINLTLSGDMTADETRIATKAKVDALSFMMDKIPYLSKAELEADVKIDANLKDMKFTFTDNQIRLNAINASLDGWLAMPEDSVMDMDIRLNAPDVQFKDVLSMIPAIYAKDFQDIKTSGEASLEAYAKGRMEGESLPAFDVKLAVANAMFQYPSLPKAVNEINVTAAITNPGGSADLTIVDVPKFHFAIAGNPFDMTLHVSTPVSDPNLNLSALGHLDLGMVKDVYPMEDMELSGKLDANLKLAARMSAIENEQYDKVNAAGNLTVSDMLYKSEDMDDVLIKKAAMAFSPKYVDLSECAVQIGKNDVAASGKLENFIPYFMKDETLRGTLAVNSNYLNLNDFMTEDPEAAASEDTSSIGVIVIPKNLDFTLNGSFKDVLFDKFEMKNVVGQILVKNGKASMNNLKMNALGGAIAVNGYYDTSVNEKQPDVSFDLNIQNASFAQTFSSFTTIQKLAPIFESVLGTYSTSFNMKAPLSSDFMPILTSLTASGLLQSNDLQVKEIPVLSSLASALKTDSLKTLSIKDLNLPFSIADGQVTTKPFDVKFGGSKMNLSGSTGLDQSINYVAKVDLAEKLTNGLLKSVNVKIGGSFTSPKITLDAADLVNQGVSKLLEGAAGSSNSAVSKVAETLGDKTAQAAAIRQQAADAGTKLVDEAKKQGQKLIDEANKTSNPLAKIAAVKGAEAAAKKLTEEAQKKADQLNAEAEKQASALEAN